MKRPEGKDVKSYCHRAKDECKIVKTGVNLLEFYSCKTCKFEVSEHIRNAQDEDISQELDLFNLFNGISFGDDI